MQNVRFYCRDVAGCDLATPKGVEKAKKTKVFEKKCHGIAENSEESLETEHRIALAEDYPSLW